MKYNGTIDRGSNLEQMQVIAENNSLSKAQRRDFYNTVREHEGKLRPWKWKGCYTMHQQFFIAATDRYKHNPLGHRLEYREGFYLDKFGALDHSWLMLDGKIFDLCFGYREKINESLYFDYYSESREDAHKDICSLWIEDGVMDTLRSATSMHIGRYRSLLKRRRDFISKRKEQAVIDNEDIQLNESGYLVFSKSLTDIIDNYYKEQSVGPT